MISKASAVLPSFSEQRADTRQSFAVPARLLGHDAIPKPVRIVDISRGGLAMLADEAMQAGDSCAIAFDADIGQEVRRINVWARVAYCLPEAAGGFRIGVHYRDYDSHSRMHIEQLCGSAGLPAVW